MSTATLVTPTQLSLPPSYSELDEGITVPTPDTLPAYSVSNRSRSLSSIRPLSAVSSTAPLKGFRAETKLDKKGLSVTVLTVCGDKGLSKSFPILVEGQALRGTVKLALEKPESFSKLVVCVHGRITTNAMPGEEFSFVEIPYLMWSQDMGDPRMIAMRYILPGEDVNPLARNTSVAPSRPRTSDGPTNDQSDTVAAAPNSSSVYKATSSQKFTSKLPAGTYIFGFSFELPKEVSLPVWNGRSKENVVYRLPQTFHERHTRGNVAYFVEVKLVKSSLLKADETMVMQFGYIPVTFPPPFPPLRAMAYEEDAPLLGPAIDPEGWHALEPVKVRGKLFSNRTVEVACTLYLAKPLAYTRTSVIPLFLQISSTDTQALDLLSSPKAIVCRLRRIIKYDLHSGCSVWGNTIDHSPLAVWWAEKGWGMSGAREAGQDSQERYLNGELHLTHGIKPSSAMAYFRIEYAVVLFPFDTAGFEGENGSGEGALAEQTVEVMTAFAHGPKPRKSAPPGYTNEDWVRVNHHGMQRSHFL